MRGEHLPAPTAVIWVGGAGFEAWTSNGRLSRLVLPPLDRLPGRGGAEESGPRESGPRAMIEMREEAGPRDEACLRTLASFLAAVIAGREPPERPPVDLEGIEGFTRRALEYVSTLPRGRRDSYAAVAAMAGSPGAARAAGRAMACNPVPLVIPCHRVVRSDGTAGGWSGAPGWKEWLLASESGDKAPTGEDRR